MATDPAEAPLSPDSVQKLAPGLSGTRGQAIQRLQVGLFGIASMVLLVGLANIIKTNVQQSEAQVVPEAAPTTADEEAGEPASDPLADAGIVPELSAKPPPAVTPPPPPENGDVSAPQP